MLSELLKSVGPRVAAAPQALGTGTNNGDVQDLQGFEGILFFCPITDVVNTSDITLKVQHGDESDGSDAADAAGASANAVSGAADDLNGKLLVVNVHRPRHRYLRPVTVVATANAELGNVIAIPYGPRTEPVPDHADVAGSGAAVSPADA